MSTTAFDQAQALLLAPYDLSPGHMEQAMGEMFTHRVDYADLYFQHTRNEAWSLDEGVVKSAHFSIDQGVGVRAIAGEKTAFAYSEVLSPQALLNTARMVKSIAQQGGGVMPPPIQVKTPRAMHYAAIDPVSSLEAADKVAILNRVEAMARVADPRVKQVMANLAAEYDVVMIAGSDGRLQADVRPLIRLSMTILVEQNGRREMGSAGGGGRYGLCYFTESRLRSYVDKALREALINLEAKPAPAGEMTVVLGAGWPGILLHEAVGHGLEGDFNRKGSSVFSGRIGEQVASKGVTVVDDGTLPDRRGSLNIDDEGNPTQRTVLIEDGILCGYLQDSQNARLMNQSLTGNGRRESFAHLTMPRMTNTFMLNGPYEPDEIIASVDNGIYAANFSGGQVDITSGKFTFSASEAYRIENGKITYPIKGATLLGNGPETMNKISMVGNNMALDSGVGTCGKEGQSVPVGVGMPTIRLDGLTVGGTA